MSAESSKIQEQHIDLATELKSYEKACKADPSFESFHSTLHQRTNRVINKLAENVKGNSLTLDSLKEVTDSFVKADQQVADRILECKSDILKNEDLYDVVKDYFDNSDQTVNLCNGLEKCLKRARDNQLVIEAAVQIFEKGQREGEGKGSSGKRKIYSKVLHELKKFKDAGNPFTPEFTSLLKSVQERHKLTLYKLKAKKDEVEKKTKTDHTWSKVTHAILWGAVGCLLVCSVALAVVAAPVIVPALATAATEMVVTGAISAGAQATLVAATADVALSGTGVAVGAALTGTVVLSKLTVWIDSLWTKYESDLKAQSDLLKSMTDKTQLLIWDLDDILLSVNKLEAEIESMLTNAEFAIGEEHVNPAIDPIEEEHVNPAIEAIKEEQSKFHKSIKELSKHIDTCRDDTMRAREKILESLKQLN